jgi:hypothetical protein
MDWKLEKSHRVEKSTEQQNLRVILVGQPRSPESQAFLCEPKIHRVGMIRAFAVSPATEIDALMYLRADKGARSVDVVIRAGIHDCESHMALELWIGAHESTEIGDDKFGRFPVGPLRRVLRQGGCAREERENRGCDQSEMHDDGRIDGEE